MRSLIDAGVNLTSSQFDVDRAALVAEAKHTGIENMLVIGCDIPTSHQALQLAREYNLVCSAGVHPHDAKSASPDLETEIKALCLAPQVVAVGECGLDYNRDFSPRPVQREIFSRQLALADELNKPVYLHERDAHDDMLTLLKEHQIKGVIHCFTGNRRELENYLELGLYIGVTGWLCDERRGAALREAALHIPASRILLETDAPYLIPRTLRPKPKSRRNSPVHLGHIAEQLAVLRNEDPEQLAKTCSDNFNTLFGIKDSAHG